MGVIKGGAPHFGKKELLRMSSKIQGCKSEVWNMPSP